NHEPAPARGRANATALRELRCGRARTEADDGPVLATVAFPGARVPGAVSAINPAARATGDQLNCARRCAAAGLLVAHNEANCFADRPAAGASPGGVVADVTVRDAERCGPIPFASPLTAVPVKFAFGCRPQKQIG